jgi:aspartate/glutamate racemase
MAVYGFLHTADAHVALFTRLLGDVAPDDVAVHIVDASLLTDARRRGRVDDDLARRIGAHLRALADGGAQAVLCTCSTIGGAAEQTEAGAGVRVIRVDRPMAALAVASGTRIAVVTALESALAPARELLLETAAAAGRTVTIVEAPCLEAWTLWESGDHDGYLARLASHVEALDASVDVIVLAQASMAPVEQRVRLTSPLLSSPRPAVAALVSG